MLFDDMNMPQWSPFLVCEGTLMGLRPSEAQGRNYSQVLWRGQAAALAGGIRGLHLPKAFDFRGVRLLRFSFRCTGLRRTTREYAYVFPR